MNMETRRIGSTTLRREPWHAEPAAITTAPPPPPPATAPTRGVARPAVPCKRKPFAAWDEDTLAREWRKLAIAEGHMQAFPSISSYREDAPLSEVMVLALRYFAGQESATSQDCAANLPARLGPTNIGIGGVCTFLRKAGYLELRSRLGRRPTVYAITEKGAGALTQTQAAMPEIDVEPSIGRSRAAQRIKLQAHMADILRHLSRGEDTKSAMFTALRLTYGEYSSNIVNDMVADGLIAKVRDKYPTILEITPAGRDWLRIGGAL